jgi:DNA polymerase III epsilon subunit-like protein
LIKLADDISIPQRITDITGITASDLSEASLPINVAFELKSVINSLQEKQIAVIHYARFELAFLKNLFQSYFGSDDLGINVLCSQKITKILYPSLPSPNIRAVMGFFGLPVGGFKRAANHVLATLEIWKLFYSIS